MVHKFSCYECGQKVSATDDWIGTEAICPACGVAFLVPGVAEDEPAAFPGEKEPEPIVAESEPGWAAAESPPATLAELLENVEALGIHLDPAARAAPSPEEHALSLATFLYSVDLLGGMLAEMQHTGEITRPPRVSELHAVHTRLFTKVTAGEWGGAEEELKSLLLEVVPGLAR